MNTPNAWDLLIRNGRIVLEDGVYSGDIAVAGGKIAALGENLGNAAEVVDASGLMVLPGCVDAHVHFNEPRPEPWEGWEHGCRCAAAGGVTTILEMPLNSVPPVTDLDSWKLKEEVAQKGACVDYALWGGLVNNNLDSLQDLYDAGAVGFKAFTAKALDFPMANDAILYEGMKWAAKTGAIIAVHTENDAMTDYYKAAIQATGRQDRRAFLEAYPKITELEAIHRVLWLAKKAGARVHIVHTSLAEGIQMVTDARQTQAATVETCPHYLYFDAEDCVEIGPAALCTPPLRPAEEREALWAQVLAGKVDIITSDNAPCMAEFKTRGEQNIWDAWPGISGIQAMLSAVWTAGTPRGLTAPQMVRLMSANPARLFGLYPQKGAIRPGADADLLLFDPDKEWTLSEDQLFSRSKINPYLGRILRGKILSTFLRGQRVYAEGEILPCRGRFIHPCAH